MMIGMLAMPAGIPAQYTEEETDSAPGFTEAELAQMLAPIALYPDSLIAEILMASTYPLEVVEAERWLRQNQGLTGEALDRALQDMDWDPSVKSLCHFPDVLFAMSDKLDQTTTLGDAYLAQQDDVMATIQTLRRKAEEQGNLNTTQQQKVIVEREYIRIEPTEPDVIYVPVYNPLYVYGSWRYPSYRPWYWYHPPGVIVTGGHIVFGRGFSIGIGIFSWSWFDWPARHIYVDYDRWPYHRPRHVVYPSGGHYWRHHPDHRRGVAYRDRRTSEHFGQRRSERSFDDREKRGYPERTPGYREQERNQRDERRQGMEREPVRREHSERNYNMRPNEPSQRTYREQNRQFEPRERVERERAPGAAREETSFGGIGHGNYERRAGERGAESRRSTVSTPQGNRTGGQTGGSRDGFYQHGGSQSGGHRR